MSTQSRDKILEASFIEGKRTGNINILLTNAIAQRVGLSASDYECYELLREEGPLMAGELARACGITTGGLTGLVDRLDKLGLVERIADPNDRRKVLVRAVDNAAMQSKIDELIAPMLQGFTALNEHYTDQELQLLLDHSIRVNAIMQDCLEKIAQN